jgi:putative phosphoesterase
MLVGLLSDIHGNVDALRAVLQDAKKLGITRYLIAGDFLGYYYSSQEILTTLDQCHWTGCMGNHEMILNDWPAYDENTKNHIIKKYGSSYKLIYERNEIPQLQRILQLKHPVDLTLEGRRFLLSHGTPWDINQYVYPDAAPSLIDRIFEMNFDCVVLGHTHYQSQWRRGSQIIVNPGSVGQPRSGEYSDENLSKGIARAHWATIKLVGNNSSDFNETLGAVEFQTSYYDAHSLCKTIEANDPNLKYLTKVLFRS